MQLTRPHAVKTVKYVNPRGGTWTVAAQRIPVQSKDDMEAEAVSFSSSNTDLFTRLHEVLRLVIGDVLQLSPGTCKHLM